MPTVGQDQRPRQVQQGAEPNIVVVALSMTTRGPSPLRNGIASLALHAGDSSGNTLQAQNWKLAPLSQHQAWTWKQPLDARESHDPREALVELRNLLDRRPDAYLVCENAARDASFLNAYLDHFDLGQITHMHDAMEYARGALRKPFNLQTMHYELVRLHLPGMRVPDKTPLSDPPSAADAAFILYLNHVALVNHVIFNQ